MAITKEQFVEWVKALNATKMKGLVEALEDELGVQAPRPTVAAVATPPPAPVAPTSFDVVLTDSGANRIQAIRVVRELTGLGLREARDLVNGAPSVVKEAVDAEQAAEVIAALEGVGAVAERRPAS